MRIRFDRGTLVLEAERADEDPAQIPGATWDGDVHAWRVPAQFHRDVLVRYSDSDVRISDGIVPVRLVGGAWQLPELRWYQRAALAQWEAADRRGVVALPTGSGKTLVALAAIEKLGVGALVLVPTRVLLDQWVKALSTFSAHAIGRIGDGDYRIEPITVSTYASAISWAPRVGDQFGLVIVDEAHHVGAWCPADVLEMLPAHARLGLTATPPPEPQLETLRDHVGPVVYALAIDDLAGDGLAPYDLRTVPITLTRDERSRYRNARSRFAVIYAEHARKTGRGNWNDFVRAAAKSADGRAALEAWRNYRSLIAFSEGKRAALREILARHPGERILVFTADNATAYTIARELLVMPVTHEIGRVERERVLARFRDGELPVLVSSQVLDEGLDVPDADIAVIVGGTASARRHVQRIGRVLRPRSGKRAVVYELSTGETQETGTVQRRRAGLVDARNASEPRARYETVGCRAVVNRDERRGSGGDAPDERRDSGGDEPDERRGSGVDAPDERRDSCDDAPDERRDSGGDAPDERRDSGGDAPDERRGSGVDAPDERRDSGGDAPDERRDSGGDAPDERHSGGDAPDAWRDVDAANRVSNSLAAARGASSDDARRGVDSPARVSNARLAATSGASTECAARSAYATAVRCDARDPLASITWPFVLFPSLERPPRRRGEVLHAASKSNGGAS